MFIAENLTQFKNLFVNKLKAILTDDELGAFILVLANSRQDAYLKKKLSVDLEIIFESLKEKFSNGSISVTQDDSDVFQQLLNFKLGDLPIWQQRSVGEWDVVFNTMRKLRPARASSEQLTSIRQNFDGNKFHFNKPFLKPEILWESDCRVNNKLLKIRVLFNKFPFSDYHLLIVVSPEECSSQFLSEEAHQSIYTLVNETAALLPGFGVGFNSLAAGASVNHLHFQGFIRGHAFPIEKILWQHNGGDKAYPVKVERFSDVQSSWRYINQLLEADRAFNCVYRNNACYVIPRLYQGISDVPSWLAGAGWLDVAGVMTVSDEATFIEIDEFMVSDALEKLS